MLGQKVLGTIGAERVYINRSLLKQDAEFLAAIALMIAPAVELFLMTNIDKVQLENENLRLKNALKERYKPSNIIGNSKPMQDDVYELIGRVAPTPATVLILGESGTGKELVANAIHTARPRANGPFITLQLRRLRRSAARERAVRSREGLVHRGAGVRKGRLLDRPTVARCSSTRSARSAPGDPGQAAARPPGTHQFERVGGNASRFESMSASSPRPTAI